MAASIFDRLFRKKQPPPATVPAGAELVSATGPVFTAWNGDAYANDIYRGAVDAIARNAAKLKGSHVITYQEQTRPAGECRINRLLQTEPNPYMSAFDMLYKLVTLYYQYNNAFAYLHKDDRGELTGIFPLCPLHIDFLSDPAGALYCHFFFRNGKETLLPYADIIHLRRNYNGDDLLGDPNTALSSTLQLAHAQNEGLKEAIKNSATIRGIIKRTQLSNVKMLKEIQEQFMKDYLDISNNGGVAVIDQASDYIPLNNSPVTIDEKQLQAVKTKIYDYLGVSESIINSSYTEDQWAAFYESTLEPIAVQLSLEFSRKIFNDRERAFGNSIMFDSGRLQFSSNATKVNLIKELIPYRLLTINQALEILNLPPVDNGDVRLQTLNVVDAANVNAYQLQNKHMGVIEQ